MADQESRSVEDILHLQAQTFREHSDLMKDHLTNLDNERKELQKSRELMEDMIGEYDRLTDRMSTQIKAMIQWWEDFKKNM